MSVTIERACTLACPPDDAWEQLQRPALLQHIAWPLLRFVPRGKGFPARWKPGEYRAWMLGGGVLPVGWQAIVISFPQSRDGIRSMRDNGYGPLIKRWDHRIEIAPGPQPQTSLYRDIVTIEAGLLTRFVAAFARIFYRHRQQRWQKLAASNFAALP